MNQLGEYRHQRGRGVFGLTAIGTSAIFLLLTTCNVAAATSITIKAPYGGSTSFVTDYASPLNAGPCMAADFVHPPAWHASTGIAAWDFKLKSIESGSCPLPKTCYYYNYPYTYCYNVTNRAEAYTYLTIGVPIGSPSTTGTHNIAVHWTLNYVASWSVTHSNCPKAIIVNGNGGQYCDVETGLDFYVYNDGSLYDLTSGTQVSSYSGWSNGWLSDFSEYSQWYHDYYCNNYYGTATCTSTNTSTGTPTGTNTSSLSMWTYLNSTSLNASHQYALEFEFYGDLSTSVFSDPQPWNASAKASLDVATGRNGLVLNSVVIT